MYMDMENVRRMTGAGIEPALAQRLGTAKFDVWYLLWLNSLMLIKKVDYQVCTKPSIIFSHQVEEHKTRCLILTVNLEIRTNWLCFFAYSFTK